MSSRTDRDDAGGGLAAGGAIGLPPIAERLRRVAAVHGTPVYLTDLAALDTAASSIREAFPYPWVRQYSLKANDVPEIVAQVTSRGFGANVVSLGEWAIARRAGVPNGRITLEGIGKTDAELRAAVRATALGGVPLAWVALESADEAEVTTRMARRAGLGRRNRPALDVLVRLNPDVSPETIPGLAVGAGASKFGLTETEATALVEWIETHAGGSVRPRGIQVHVGSQLRAVDAWRDAVRRALAVVGLLRGGLPRFDTLDVGGGFPVLPLDEPVPGPERFARELPALLDGIPEEHRPTRLAIEPGRALVARSGWLVTSVLHVRDRGGRQVVVDAGMTELIRPALYGARHPIVALTSEGRPILADATFPSEPTRVEGPVCESTDALGVHELPPLRRGDLVAISDAGAYAASLASTYNGRPRAPQVLLEVDGSATLVRRRGWHA